MRARKVLLLAGALAALYALLRSFSGPHRFSGSRPTLTELFRASETDKVSTHGSQAAGILRSHYWRFCGPALLLK